MADPITLVYGLAGIIVLLTVMMLAFYSSKMKAKNPPLEVHVIGKDNKLRTYLRHTKKGHLVEIPEGQIIIDPKGVYWNTRTGRPAVFVYVPYAANVPAELAVYAKKAKDSGLETLEEAEKQKFVAKVEGPTQIFWHEITGFFKYNINPIQVRWIILNYLVNVLGKKTPLLAIIITIIILLLAGIGVWYFLTHPIG